MRDRFTNSFLKTIESPGKDLYFYDSKIRSLGCRITAAGGRLFFVDLRINGRRRRVTLGRVGDLTVATARKAAEARLREAAAGRDVVGDRQGPTVKQVAADFEKKHVSQLKPKTRESYTYLLRDYVVAKLGSKRIADVDEQDGRRLLSSLTEKPTTANRALECLSSLITYAEDIGARPVGSNPLRRLRRLKHKLASRRRYLSEHELARFGEALEELDHADLKPAAAINLLRALLLTGCRRDELRLLKWDAVDLERQFITLRDSKTGPTVRRLGTRAAQLFAEIPQTSAFVFSHPAPAPKRQKKRAAVAELLDQVDAIRTGSTLPPEKTDKHPRSRPTKPEPIRLASVRGTFAKACELAKIADFRIHDLRHQHASIAVAEGGSLPAIGGLLGHVDSKTTQRYAHLLDSTVQDLADKTSERIGKTLDAGARHARAKRAAVP